MSSAGIPSTKEPTGLTRDDGKRPDGLTLTPWQDGRSLAWDVTVSNTLAASYVGVAAQQAGGVAERAAERKISKYSALSNTYTFLPVAFETLGPLNASALDFITELGRRISAQSDDPRECSFLFQRLSVTIQRYNSIALMDSFTPVADSDS
jgi:hypothetical protein